MRYQTCTILPRILKLRNLPISSNDSSEFWRKNEFLNINDFLKNDYVRLSHFGSIFGTTGSTHIFLFTLKFQQVETNSWRFNKEIPWRREGDSNPRSAETDTRFPSVRTRPLCDLSRKWMKYRENYSFCKYSREIFWLHFLLFLVYSLGVYH